MTLYRVSADIRYLDGTLAGLLIPSGFSTTYPRMDAYRAAERLNHRRITQAPIRACASRNSYVICSVPRVTCDELLPFDTSVTPLTEGL